MPNELTVTAIIVIVLYVIPEIIRRIRRKPVTDMSTSATTIDQSAIGRGISVGVTVAEPTLVPRVIKTTNDEFVKSNPGQERTPVGSEVRCQQLIINRNALVNGVIWSEILAKPRLRKKTRF